MNAFLAAATAEELAQGWLMVQIIWHVFLICLAIALIMVPFRILKEIRKSNAQLDTLILHVATLNSNLVAYGQSMEKRLDAVSAGKQKTPGQAGHGVRYEIGAD